MMSTPAIVEPAAFVASTVYWDAANGAPGVPEISPVVGLRLKPAGKAGVTL
jgi:hypothetical protein